MSHDGRRQEAEYPQQLLDHRLREQAAWQALQEVAHRLLGESTRAPRRFSTLAAYARAHREWRGARYALDLASVRLLPLNGAFALPPVYLQGPRHAPIPGRRPG